MVGLPTALLFDLAGDDVLGIDIDEERLAAYRAGSSPRPLEPGVADLLRAACVRGRIRFASRPEAADVHIIAVSTPLHAGRADLRGVRAVVASLRQHLRDGDLVVIESTVPPGTTSEVARGLPPGVLVAHAPERVLPGHTLEEMRTDPRVIGGATPAAAERAAEVYSRIASAPMARVEATLAEFTKLIENTYRDVNIALANELALMAADLGIDVWAAIELANAHPRVHIHRPGPGVGGHCIPFAPHFLREAAPDRAALLMAARERNLAMPGIVANGIMALARDRPRPRVALLGVAYKADVADERESPTRAVEAILRASGADVVAHDPLLTPALDLADAVRGADCAALLVAHSAYRALDPADLGALMANRRILDAVGMLERSAWTEAGFEFRALAERAPAAQQLVPS